MSLEDKLKKFSDRLNRQTETHRRRYEQDRAEIWAEYRQTEQSQQSRRQSQPPLRSAASPLQARLDMGGAAILHQIDELMWRLFELERWFSGRSMRHYPVVYCETLSEFFEAIFKAEDRSETVRRQMVAQAVQEAKEQASSGQGGTLGVHLPGDRCYINGWLFGVQQGKTAQAALDEPAAVAKILETVCHEKLGHGFIAELTALGQNKQALGLGMYDLARRFDLRPVDRPDSALLRNKHELIFQASIYLEEGWATWIESALLEQGGPGQPEAPPKYSLPQVAAVFQQAQTQGVAGPPEAEATDLIEALGTATHHLLLADSTSEAEALVAMRIWQEAGPLLDPQFSQTMGQPAWYVLGYLLLRRLEARLGWQNLPLAVAIAANVQYDLAQISLTDLAYLLETDPRLNPNARLALLGQLDLAPDYDRRQLIHQARERLSLAPPAGWIT